MPQLSNNGALSQKQAGNTVAFLERITGHHAHPLLLQTMARALEMCQA